MEKQRKALAQAMKREELAAENQGKQPSALVESRLKDFEQIKLLGKGNFSVSSRTWMC